ncbi:MAG TPA: ABC transporter permease [Ilumatobacteraceae bacterium]|nr:ABC transporter permease [Ilumatobacteraceae bacterium]
MTSTRPTSEQPPPSSAPAEITDDLPVIAAADTALTDAPPERLEGRRLRAFLRNRPAMVSLVFLTIIVGTAALAPWIAPLSPTKNELRLNFATPWTRCVEGVCSAPGLRILGTDDLGRDIFSRLLYASRISLLVGLGSVLVALVVALPLGMIAGYVGGKLDWVMMRIVDIILSIPPLILVFAVAGVLGASIKNAILALGVFFVPLFVRLIRSEVLNLRSSQLVETERAIGVPDSYILVRHVLPNIASPLIVQVSLSIGTAILAEASLSFLGLGVQAPTPSWGIMLKSAFDFISRHPWMVLPPSLTIAFTVLALNIIGDGLRDALGKVR